MCGALVEFTRTKLGQTHPMSHSQAQLSAERAASFLSQSLRTVSRASHFLCNGDSRDEQVNLGVVIKEGVTSVAGHVILASHVTAAGWDVTAFCSAAEVGTGDEHELILLAGSIVGHHSAHIKYPNSTMEHIQSKDGQWTPDMNCTCTQHQGPK